MPLRSTIMSVLQAMTSTRVCRRHKRGGVSRKLTHGISLQVTASCLRAGKSLSGNLFFGYDDAGTAAAPVIVGSYGTGRATINAAGTIQGIRVENAGGFEIRDLIIVGAGRTVNGETGVEFIKTFAGAYRLDYVRIHNVSASGFGWAGISIDRSAGDGGYSNVRITNCEVFDNQDYGIYIGRAGNGDYAHSDVQVRYCRAHHNTGDPSFSDNHSGSGIAMFDVDGGKIERCVAWENGSENGCTNCGPVGIWAAGVNNVTIQYNESYNNRSGTGLDGGGFDFDGGVINSSMQYNYSHGNDGPGYLVYAYPGSVAVRNNTVRYNISENDGRKNEYGGIHVAKDLDGVAKRHRDLQQHYLYVSRHLWQPQSGTRP